MTRPWIVAAAVTLACTGNSQVTPQTASVTGTVAYRERLALPPDAVVQVQLTDVSRQEVAAPVVAETTITTAGRQVPLPFELRYDPARIEANRSYAVRATIRSEERLLFTTATAIPVLTRGNPGRVALTLVQAAAAAPTGPAPGSLAGTSWVLEAIGGTSVLGAAGATLEFPEAGRVAGRGSCNSFFGSVEISGQAIAFDSLGSTLMGCDEAVMNQEGRYLKALQDAARFTIDGRFLFLHTKTMEKALRFRQEPR